MDILNKIAALYETKYNSTCIIDTGMLTIDSPDGYIHFKNVTDMSDYLLTEILLSEDIEI